MAIQFRLDRFVTAQDRVFGDVCAELAAGEKSSHWMWFVFPQTKASSRATHPHARARSIPSRPDFGNCDASKGLIGRQKVPLLDQAATRR